MNIKKVLFVLSAIIILLYLPLAFTIYSSSWYELNYKNQGTYEQLGDELTTLSTTNLINYFLHKEELGDFFTQKEKLHYKDVRNIYDLLFVITILAIFLAICTFRYEYIKSLLIASVSIPVILSPIFLFFNFFWIRVFHPLFFSNNYWINYPNEISYYLFTNQFFLNSILLILIVFIIENLIIFTIVNYNLILKVSTKQIKRKN